MTDLDKARCKRLITQWCRREYGEDCIDSGSLDPTQIQILYSSDGDNDEHTVEVIIDLLTKSFLYFYDGKKVYSMTAGSTGRFMQWLENMDWQEEYGTCVRKGPEEDCGTVQ